MPRNPATIWVSNTVAGTAPHAASSTSRSCAGGVGDGHARSVEDRRQRGGVDGQRIDQGHLVGPGDLDEREVGDVGALRVELGVEAVVLLVADGCDERVETAAVEHHDRRRGHQAGSVVTRPVLPCAR